MGIFSGLLHRDHPSNPSKDFLYAIGGGHRSYTGKNITEDSAMTGTAFFGGVRLVSEVIGSLPLFLYERLPDGKGKRKATDHPLFLPLHLKPNPLMSSITLRETLAGHAMVWGTAYAEKVKNKAGQVAELWPLNPANMAVGFMGENEQKLVYSYVLPNGKVKMFAENMILRVPGFSQDGLTGLNPVELGGEAIGLSLALEEFGARFFGNGAVPNSVLEHPEQLSDEAYEHLKTAFNERYQGLSNSNRTAILEEGMKLKEFGVSPEQAQAIESRRFQIEEVARLLNIPVHMLKELSRATFNNIEMLSQEFVTFSLTGWLVRFEQAYTIQLLKEKELQNYFFEHLLTGLLRGDTQARHESYAKGRQWGYLSVNDIRTLENMNAVDDGDVYLQPLNMIEAGTEPPAAPGTAPPGKGGVGGSNNSPRSSCGCKKEIRADGAKLPKGRTNVMKTFEPLLKNASDKVVNFEVLRMRKIVKKNIQRDEKSFLLATEEFYKDTMKEVLKRDMGPVLTAYAEQTFNASIEEIGEDISIDEDFREFVNEYIDGFVDQYADTSVGQMRQLTEDLDEALLFEGLNERLDEWQEKKADKISERQLNSVSNGAAVGAFFAAGSFVVWRNRGDSCPYCKGLEGKRIKQGNYFIDDSSKYQPKGASRPLNGRTKTLYPPIHKGCDCIVTPG